MNYGNQHSNLQEALKEMDNLNKKNSLSGLQITVPRIDLDTQEMETTSYKDFPNVFDGG